MSSLWTKWNFSSFDCVALNMRTGTETSPNEIVPDQIERAAMHPWYPGRRGSETRRFMSAPAWQPGPYSFSPPDGGLGARGRCSHRPQRVPGPVENPVESVDRPIGPLT